MKKRATLVMLANMLLASTAAGASGTTAWKFSGTVDFGDSLVDAGNYYIATGGAFPDAAEGFFRGRNTNGYDYTDLLNIKLTGAPTVASLAGGVNYGFGGASVAGSFADQIDQYSQHLAETSGVIDPHTLFTVTYGDNDQGAIDSGDYGGAGSREAALRLAAADYAKGIQTLADMGARNLLITGFLYLDTPTSHELQALLDADLKALKLPAGTTLYEYSFLNFFDRAATDPASLGLPSNLNVTVPCRSAGVEPDCENYLFYDGDHPTGAAHQAILEDLNRRFGLLDPSFALDSANSGLRSIHASGKAGSPDAAAWGFSVGIDRRGAYDVHALSGSITNSGMLEVTAQATARKASAYAAGVELRSYENSATLSNSGTIAATAITAGGSANATGIRIAHAPSWTSDSPNKVITSAGFTLDNAGGTIIARESRDGGKTFAHGIAIDTSDAPSPVAINLAGASTGAGFVYGDIDLGADDVVTARSGETDFDGTLNGAATGHARNGTLDIAKGGTLYVMDTAGAGSAAVVNVGALDIAGALVVTIPSTAATAAPVINATNTTLRAGSTLKINPNPTCAATAACLYQTSKFEVIASQEPIKGSFGSVALTTATTLLSATAQYDAQDCAASGTGACDVFVTVTRKSFADPNGVTLTANQRSVGAGIEAAYSPALTGSYAKLLGTLFTLDPDRYAHALDQLTGAQYADFLQSLKYVGGNFNAVLVDAGDCGAVAENPQNCRNAHKGALWGTARYLNGKQTGDAQAAGYSQNQYTMILGTDLAVSRHLTLGIAGGYLRGDQHFDRYAGRIRADGFQVGGYGAYDDGRLFARGVVSYSDMSGSASRSVAIGGSTGTIRGKPDADLWTVTGKVGMRLAMGASASLSPFGQIDYSRATLDGFTERGVPGADLRIDGGRQTSWRTELGARWSGYFGGISPSIEAGWRHLFGARRATVDSAFAAEPSGLFSIASLREHRDAAAISAGIAGRIGHAATVKLSFDGDFGKSLHSNAGRVSFIIPLGA